MAVSKSRDTGTPAKRRARTAVVILSIGFGGSWLKNMKSCNQCGKCCIKYADGGLSATPDEIDWWEEHRPGIAKYVTGGDIWKDPVTGQQLSRCPWLIYHDRPDDCKQYPVHIAEMVRDECEMIEKSDLVDSQKAQRRLDIIMSDSRPHYGA
jgi:Fe-S-cluster containining protein